MDLLDNFVVKFMDNLPHYLVAVAFIIFLYLANMFIKWRLNKKARGRFRGQVVTIILFFIGLIAVIILLPLANSIQGQLLSLIGLLLSAAIALSSTTLIGNAMAGFMLRTIRNFKSGDFISIDDHFGRVSERGLFHVEIQTEDSDLTTLPNLYVMTNPVSVIRSTGTIISAEVSLGYDLPCGKIEALLIDAATATGLQNPFVHVLDLGDFSITYRLAGMTTEVKKLLSTRSQLRRNMMEKLHQGGVEIVSPTFMNTRALSESKRFIPPTTAASPVEESPVTSPEHIVFDKAEAAESLEKLHEMASKTAEEIAGTKKMIDAEHDADKRDQLQRHLDQVSQRAERIAEIIKRREEEEKK